MAAMTELMTSSLRLLSVPAAFARHDKIADTTILADLDAWKSNTEPLLNRLDLSDTSSLSIAELADLVCALAPLTAVAPWTSPPTRSLASVHLAKVPGAEKLITHVLMRVVKPLFAATPHPFLHTTTARVLARPADVQDTYIDQPWKEHPGLDEVIRWCLLNTQGMRYESMWPLFLPPVMSFLDDYQVPHKLLGVRLVSDMLARVPPDLLLRTGVDALMFNSLTNSLSHLGDKSTPDFIRQTVATTIQLIDLTTPSAFPSHSLLSHDELQSEPATVLTHILSPSLSKSLSIRFSRLSTLISSSLLGTVIMYTPTFPPTVTPSALECDPFVDPQHMDTDPVSVPATPLKGPISQKRNFNPTLVAAAQALPSALLAIDVGGARFLRGIIPVLAEWLALPLPVFAADSEAVNALGDYLFVTDIALHLASLSSLSVLFRTCTSRIEGWSTTITDALGRCWVGCLDLEGQGGNTDSLQVLKKKLQEVAAQLAEVCPSVVKDEYTILLAFNKALFGGLLVGDSQ